MHAFPIASSSAATPAAATPAAPRPASRWRDEIHKARALVVDANPTTRNVLASQLRELGITQVTQCARIVDARQRLESTRFDIVLCEQEFADGGGTGQQLLDDLRRNQLLPLSTVFVMLTSQATYAQVAEAAESALDSYLLKPHNGAALAERLMHARRRKAMLHDILQAVDERRYAEGAELCLARFRARADYWLHAAHIGSELLLKLNRADQARALFDAVLQAKPGTAWAQLGVARSQIESGEVVRSVRTLEALLLELPGYADAHDVLGRARLEQGDFDAAMEAYERAVQLTPDSIPRLQKAGMLACYRGQFDAGARWLERVVSMGVDSKMFDWQSAMLLAFARLQQRDARGLQRCCDEIAAAAARAPDSRRLHRLTRVAGLLPALLVQQTQGTDAVLGGARALIAEIDEPDFDIEAAGNLATLLALIAAAGLSTEGFDDCIDRIALRHSGSRILTELLVRSVAPHPPFAQRIQAGHTQVARLAEAALAHALAGQPEQAVRQLLADAEATLSFKLYETARMTLHRHRARVAAAGELDGAIEELKNRMAPQRSPLVESNGRKPGALVLRRTNVAPEVQTTISPGFGGEFGAPDDAQDDAVDDAPHATADEAPGPTADDAAAPHAASEAATSIPPAPAPAATVSIPGAAPDAATAVTA